VNSIRFFRPLDVAKRVLQVRERMPTDLADAVQLSAEIRPQDFPENFEAGIIGYVVRWTLVAVAGRFGIGSLGLGGPQVPAGSFFTVDEALAYTLPVGGVIRCGIGGVPVGIGNGNQTFQCLDDRIIPALSNVFPPGLISNTQDMGVTSGNGVWDLVNTALSIRPRAVIKSQNDGGAPEVWNMESSVANQGFVVGITGRIFLKGRAF
jgi:hypothetical protein